ncbi:MAG TPA: GTPase Era [Candidatus Alectryocaccomicrobium excrementavium]|uniref:GTPase Era n=1 Tax=Candidatus Alectryocaccomicrobium excrementavium TaxID=2840668 RepID=A0A9D1K6Z0_9FIRM|nr:GTPase Era [Candidatus Alectryocaccomicrobium excrementavium]
MGEFHSGFVAILGRPNVGKSSLMNRMVGEKVAIVSERPQTTRNRILGVAAGEGWQIVFVDTPGLHKPRNRLGEFMMQEVEAAREDVDAVLAVVDGAHLGERDAAILDDVRHMACPRFLAVNKTDLVTPEQLMPRLASLNVEGFERVFSVSARQGDNVEALKNALVAAMPVGPQYFPDDMVTDQPERVICAEIIREKALRNLYDEVPHGIGVEMMGMQKIGDGRMEIHATIYCEKASHKGVIIGRQGAMLKKIGSEARADIERLLGCKVMLRLWVKVREDWRNRTGDLKTLGYGE